MRVRRSGGSRQKKDRPGTKVACLTIELYRGRRYTPSLDINKPKIQCDQSNIIDVERGMWNVPKWVAIRSRWVPPPSFFSMWLCWIHWNRLWSCLILNDATYITLSELTLLSAINFISFFFFFGFPVDLLITLNLSDIRPDPYSVLSSSF